MKRLLIACLILSGCDRTPTELTAPTAVVDPPKKATSRVDPNSLEDSELESLTLDHNPWAPGVELCRTKLRPYGHADGVTVVWTIDYYTVMAPETCPDEPIE